MILATASSMVAPWAPAAQPPQVRIVQWPRESIRRHRAEALEIEIDIVTADAFAGVLEMRVGDRAGAEREAEIALPLEMAAGSRTERAIAIAIPRLVGSPLRLRWWLRASDGSLPVGGEGLLYCPPGFRTWDPEWLEAEDIPPRSGWLPSAIVLVIAGVDLEKLDASRRGVLLDAVACGRTLVLVPPLAPLPATIESEMRRDDASCWKGARGEEIREIAYGLGTIREVAADVSAARAEWVGVAGAEWPLGRFALASRARRWQLLDLGPGSDRPWWYPKTWDPDEVLDAGSWSTPMATAAAAIARARGIGAAIAAGLLLLSLALVIVGRWRRTSRPALALGAAVLVAPLLVWLALHRRPVSGIDADLQVIYHDPRGLVSVREITRWSGGSGGANPSIVLCPEADSQVAYPDLALPTLRLDGIDDGCVMASPVDGLPAARRWVGASMRTARAADPAWEADVRWESGQAVGSVTALRSFDTALLALPPRVIPLGAVEAGRSYDVGPMIAASLGGASSDMDADVHAAVEMALARAGDGVPHPLVLIGVNRRAASAREPPLIVEVQGVEIAGTAGGASHWGRVVPYTWSGPAVSAGPSFAAVPAGGEALGFPLPPQHVVDVSGNRSWRRVDPATRFLPDDSDPSWLLLEVDAARVSQGEPGFEMVLRWNAHAGEP